MRAPVWANRTTSSSVHALGAVCVALNTATSSPPSISGTPTTERIPLLAKLAACSGSSVAVSVSATTSVCPAR